MGAFGQNENVGGSGNSEGPAFRVAAFRGAGELAAHRATRKPFDSPACSASALGPSGNRGTTRFSLQAPSFGSEFRGTTPVLTCALVSVSSSNTRSCTSEAPGLRTSVNVSPAPAPHTGSSVLRRTLVLRASRAAPLSSRARTNESVSLPASDAARCLPATTHTCTCRTSFGFKVRAAKGAFAEAFLRDARYLVKRARTCEAPNAPGANAASAGRVVMAPVAETRPRTYRPPRRRAR